MSTTHIAYVYSTYTHSCVLTHTHILFRAPISLNKIDWEQPFLPRDELISRITKHYRNSVLAGFYRLIGAFEFLGNPTGQEGGLLSAVISLCICVHERICLTYNKLQDGAQMNQVG